MGYDVVWWEMRGSELIFQSLAIKSPTGFKIGAVW